MCLPPNPPMRYVVEVEHHWLWRIVLSTRPGIMLILLAKLNLASAIFVFASSGIYPPAGNTWPTNIAVDTPLSRPVRLLKFLVRGSLRTVVARVAPSGAEERRRRRPKSPQLGARAAGRRSRPVGHRLSAEVARTRCTVRACGLDRAQADTPANNNVWALNSVCLQDFHGNRKARMVVRCCKATPTA